MSFDFLSIHDQVVTPQVRVRGGGDNKSGRHIENKTCSNKDKLSIRAKQIGTQTKRLTSHKRARTDRSKNRQKIEKV